MTDAPDQEEAKSTPGKQHTARRLRREARTVEVMIAMYCRDHHDSADLPEGGGRPALCPDCAGLLEYSLRRVETCRFGADKPTCARCTVHCYRPAMREQIRAAMGYSGPRMTYRHPYLAARHLMDRKHEP